MSSSDCGEHLGGARGLHLVVCSGKVVPEGSARTVPEVSDPQVLEVSGPVYSLCVSKGLTSLPV